MLGKKNGVQNCLKVVKCIGTFAINIHDIARNFNNPMKSIISICVARHFVILENKNIWNFSLQRVFIPRHDVYLKISEKLREIISMSRTITVANILGVSKFYTRNAKTVRGDLRKLDSVQ